MSQAFGDPPAWVADAVFYQVFPDRYASSPRVPKPGPMEPWDAPPTRHGFKGGDLIGLVEHLDHIERLGATALYLNPVFASASNHRYHTFDYLVVDELLGGEAALRELLDAAHARGIRVVLDGVFNHASRGFWPFHHIMETGGSSPYRDWFYLDNEALDAGRPLRAYAGETMREGLITTDWAEQHRPGTQSLEMLGYRAWWDLPALPKLNVGNPRVREYLLGVAEHWGRFGIDGWRLDVPEEIEDHSFWREFRQRVRAVNPEAYIVAEIWRERRDRLKGDSYDALMNYPLAQALISFLPGDQLRTDIVAQHGELAAHIRHQDGRAFLRRLTRAATVYRPQVTRAMLNLIDSHDTPRFLTMANGDRDALRMAWLVLMTMPGAPCIYYGDEIGLEGAMDPDCRRGFPWDESRWDRSLLDHLRGLIRLRHAEPMLRHGDVTPLLAEGMAVAYLRSSPGEPGGFVVALNAGDTDATLRLRLPDGLAGRLVPVGVDQEPAGEAVPIEPGGSAVVIGPRRGRLLRVEPM